MARDRTYVDLIDEIKGTKDLKVIDECLTDITSKYGSGAANKAISTCGLEKLGVKLR